MDARGWAGIETPPNLGDVVVNRILRNAGSFYRNDIGCAPGLNSTFILADPELFRFIVGPRRAIRVNGQIDDLLGGSKGDGFCRFGDVGRIGTRGPRTDVERQRCGCGKRAIVGFADVDAKVGGTRHGRRRFQLGRAVARTTKGPEIGIYVIGHREFAVIAGGATAS